MTILDEFEAAMNNDLIRPAVADMLNLWQLLGQPEPPVGPDTSVKGLAISWIQDSEDGIDSKAAAKYNASQVQLFELTGMSYIGGDQFYTKHDEGSPSWQEYREKSQEIASDFINNRLWDRFCGCL